MTKTPRDLRFGSPTLLALVLACVVTGAGCGNLKPPFRDAAAPDAGGGDVANARFHAVGSSTPGTCLPCHGADAPTSTVGWLSTTYARSPFDYGTNSLGIAHGGGQDCAGCHRGPGTGAWGKRANWVGGHFVHGPLTLAEKTCIACHLSQRPDLQPGATAASAAALVGFDHARYPAMDCIGCHWATVAAETYVNYFNPATSALPGGDWRGGQSYPGSTPVGFPGERLELVSTTLTLSPTNDFVASATERFEEVRDLMIHTAAMVPAEVRPGPADAPDYGKCWHCHASRNGVVWLFPQGKFHFALEQYRVTPDGPITPLPQPTQNCKECHAATLPTGLVGRSSLRPMQHAIEFAAPVVVGGVAATGVRDLDCSVCHKEPLGLFSQGAFHRSIEPATPKECVSCHYLTMADASAADVRSGTAFEMRHTSAQLTFHTCTTCHPSALANATSGEIAAESWKPGYYHAVLATQPTLCSDCHAVSLPTATPGAFDHGALTADAGTRDCGDCHAFPGTGTLATPNWLGATNPS